MANYPIGQLVRLTATFQNGGVSADPTGVNFYYTKENELPKTIHKAVFGVDLNLIKTATGVYYYTISTDIHGRYYWRWEATGTGQTAQEGYFDVDVSPLVGG